ncbi:MAG: hypothetical protein JWM73_1530 [Solirubrobacterales bacterium]|jgi:hypothetical protein|nr:hypothetical protein [Solirubrobacterales bacterium]
MPFETIDSYVAEVGGRRLADGEWGLVAGAVEVGLRASRGVLRAQAWAAPAGSFDPLAILHRNRSLELVRYATTKAGELWVVGEVIADDDAPVDRLLGTLIEAVVAVRPSGSGSA